MGHNKLTRLPDEISELRQLRTFIADSNELCTLPTTIVALDELETLDLTGNRLEALPSNFYKMKSLTTAHTYRKYYKHGLWLHKNPLTVPPPSVWVTNNPTRIYDYLRKLEIRQTPNLQRQKLMLLGATQAGKTSLVRTMNSGGQSVLTRPLVDATELLELRAWRTENNVSYLMYDFGGSEVYKPTFPLFIDAKALFLIVYDHYAYTQNEEYEWAIGQWIDMLLMQAPGAVVKIVGTHVDLCDDKSAMDNASDDSEVVSRLMGRVREQLLAYTEKLKDELVDLAEKLSNDELEAYEIAQLKEQKGRLEHLVASPVCLIDEASLVSSAESTRGLSELKAELEVISVDKTLFGHAQREVPDSWFQLNATIKTHESFCLTWREMCAIARRLGIGSEPLPDCLRFLRDIGQVLWYDDVPHLSTVVFHKPSQLIRVFRCIFRHDQATFFDYKTNRTLRCKGGFTEDVFDEAERRFRGTGEISRALLLTQWFYLKLSYAAFDELVQLTSRLDLWYAVPQPLQPLHRTQFQALLIVPTFNQDAHNDHELDRRFPDSLPTNQRELSLHVSFPLGHPKGVYERFACRLQALVYFRVDWSDRIYAEMESCKLLVSQDLDADANFRLQLRGVELRRLKEAWMALSRELRNVLKTTPGLVWYTQLNAEGCEPFGITECFPQDAQVI